MSITAGTYYSINTIGVDGTNQKTIVTTDEYIYGVDLSRDGRKIAYISSDPDSGYYQVFSLDTATGQSTRLTSTSSEKYDAMFTPDGNSVVYRAYTGSAGNAELWKVSSTGGTETIIATNSGICLHEPHVSLDGTQVVFDYHDATHPDVIGYVNIDGTGFTTVPNNMYVYTPALSLDKSRVFYSDFLNDYPVLSVIKKDGTGLTPLVSTGLSIDAYPIGDKVLFLWDTTGDYTDLDIYSMNPDGSSPLKLTNGGRNFMHWYSD